MKVKLNWHYIVDGAEVEIHYIEPEVYPYEPEIYRQCQYRSKSRNEDKCDELLKRIEKPEKEIEVLEDESLPEKIKYLRKVEGGNLNASGS